MTRARVEKAVWGFVELKRKSQNALNLFPSVSCFQVSCQKATNNSEEPKRLVSSLQRANKKTGMKMMIEWKRSRFPIRLISANLSTGSPAAHSLPPLLNREFRDNIHLTVVWLGHIGLNMRHLKSSWIGCFFKKKIESQICCVYVSFQLLSVEAYDARFVITCRIC